jgi:uncharacterized membrane-anchored protein
MEHFTRLALHNEVHARPPHPVVAPLHTIHLVMLCSPEQRTQSREALHRLLTDYHCPIPDSQAGHVRVEIGGYTLRWEMHTEFVSWTFSRTIRTLSNETLAREQLQQPLPANWQAMLPGQILVHHHMWVMPQNASEEVSDNDLIRHLLHEDTLVGSRLHQDVARVYTDLSIHDSGESRGLLFVSEMPARRLGRLLQQLLEIETYRMAALLGLPVARSTSAELGQAERELAELANSIRNARPEDEASLLDRLTRLAAQVEGRYASNHSRFSASRAYFELVDERLHDIAEQALPNLQTLGEFLHRRLSPARNTCVWVANREDAISQRISRMSNLLRTRVEIEQQQGTQALLDAMNQRQALQLRLQSTVEGLSVAAITYYVVGLLGYLIKGFKPEWWPLSSETSLALALPFVALAVWWGMRRVHHRILSRD